MVTEYVSVPRVCVVILLKVLVEWRVLLRMLVILMLKVVHHGRKSAAGGRPRIDAAMPLVMALAVHPVEIMSRRIGRPRGGRDFVEKERSRVEIG